MTQKQSKLFSCGLELASFVASSDLLTSSCKLISDLYAETHSGQNLFWKIDSESGLTIIAFGSTQNHVQYDLLHSIDKDDNPFKFICSKPNPNVSLNRSVFSLFNECRTQLDQLKSESEINLEKPVIVTGHAVGGSIASLFTLLLLEKMDPEKKHKRPLCITFGSPLLGDQKLQQALSQSSYLNSCFLHVISLKDPCLASPISDDYRSFGIFLFCSDHGSACFENPDSILKIQKGTSQLNQGLQIHDYEHIVWNLNHKAICKEPGVIPNSIPHSDEFKACISLQFWALGFPQLQQAINLENLMKELHVTLDKKKRFIPNKKLDNMKINMAYLEWYKKVSKEKGIGYYDCSKMQYDEPDHHVINFRKQLNLYWEQMVEEVEKQPQKEGAAFRTRWLYAGTNYRRMVEPLDIACYYKEGGRDYIKQGRSEHYKLLEKWMESDKKEPGSNELENRQNVRSILTLDSCFWAHVEEALISSQKLKAVASNATEKQEAVNSLDKFEKYVYGLLKKYAVSPEIFLEKSSFMRWWKEYYTIKGGASHDSELASFMKNRANYKKYEDGAYDFR